MNLEAIVNNYHTKYESGFTNYELEDLLTNFPEIDRDRFYASFLGTTYCIIDGVSVKYHVDVLMALYNGLS